jgi:putative membrane protein insertion efficiency factor
MRLKVGSIPQWISTLYSGLEMRSSTSQWTMVSLPKRSKKPLSLLLNHLALLLINIYRTIGSSWLGGGCRFEPSCSQYCLECFKNLGFFQALRFSVKRVCKCRPGGGMGYDPVPISVLTSSFPNTLEGLENGSTK